MSKFVILALIFGAALSCSHGIRLLGIDKHGAKDIKVSSSQYSKKMGRALADIHDSAIIPANKILVDEDDKVWRVKWFNVGMALQGKLGIAGLVTLGVRPRVRLYFERKK